MKKNLEDSKGIKGVEMDADMDMAEEEEIKEVVTILFIEKKKAKIFLNYKAAEKIKDWDHLKWESVEEETIQGNM